MSKKLRNTTNSDIALIETGLTIPALSTVVINVDDYILLASQESVIEVTSYINTGDIVVADDLGDISTIARMIDYLSYPDDAFNIRFLSGIDRSSGFDAKNLQEATEEVKFNKRTENNDICVPADNTLQVHSTVFLKELKLDGEVYIL